MSDASELPVEAIGRSTGNFVAKGQLQEGKAVA